MFLRKKENKHKQYIHYAMAKYGVENFTFTIIASCIVNDQIDIDNIENIIINQYNSRNKEFGYNLRVGGSRGFHSEKTKQKIRQATLK